MQISLFDGNKPFKITKPIRLIELFAGIGAQAKALKNIGADFEHWIISEWETSAVKSYRAIHLQPDKTDYSAGFNKAEIEEILFKLGISVDGKQPLSMAQIKRKSEKWKRAVYNDFRATNNIGSIVNAKGEDLRITDTDDYCYIMTYSFPCQDLSNAGKGQGMSKGSGTRSELLWEVERLLRETKELPQVLLMENVPPVLKAEGWAEWIEFLDNLGYKSRYEVLNAKDFGIPQNRARVFMVSILGDYFYTFPQKQKLRKRLRDMLEPEPVDKKFYLTDAQIEATLNSTFQQTTNKIQDEGGGVQNAMRKRFQRPNLCKTIRAGGRGSTDRHCWDLIEVENERD